MEGYLTKLYVMGLRVISFLPNISGMWLCYRNEIIKNIHYIRCASQRTQETLNNLHTEL